jgi:hypothetical protein
MSPSLLIIESARVFDAEASALVGVFASRNFAWTVISNDPMWKNSDWPTKEAIVTVIRKLDPTFVHFALHGTEEGLVLGPAEIVGIEQSILSWSEIETMDCWKKRVVIAGACNALPKAESFFRAGAVAVVAPEGEVNWERLCHFFRLFYSELFNGKSLSETLQTVTQYGDGYSSWYTRFGIVGNKHWAIPMLNGSVA